MVVNPQHYRRLTLKQTMDAENVLLEQGKVIDFPLKPSDLLLPQLKIGKFRVEEKAGHERRMMLQFSHE